MVTTGAAPTVAVLKEELKNHPEKAMQIGIKELRLEGFPFHCPILHWWECRIKQQYKRWCKISIFLT